MQVRCLGANVPSNSTGKVGTYGPSYLGIDQLLLAGAVGKELQWLAGGTYRIERTPVAASSLTVELDPALSGASSGG